MESQIPTRSVRPRRLGHHRRRSPTAVNWEQKSATNHQFTLSCPVISKLTSAVSIVFVNAGISRPREAIAESVSVYSHSPNSHRKRSAQQTAKSSKHVENPQTKPAPRPAISNLKQAHNLNIEATACLTESHILHLNYLHLDMYLAR